MWRSNPTRCTLNVDLTRYHRHLDPGVGGELLTGVVKGPYGQSGRFGAVRFDCCGKVIDVALCNLDIHWPEPPPVPKKPRRRWWTFWFKPRPDLDVSLLHDDAP